MRGQKIICMAMIATSLTMHGDDCYIVDEAEFADSNSDGGWKRKHLYVIDREGRETGIFH